MATGRGVYRFDGNEVVPLSQILPNYRKELSGYIPWIMIDDHENLWLSNGYIYELNTGNMHQNTIAGEPMLNAPLMDRQGNFWFNHHDRYVKYDRKNKRSVSVEAPVSSGFDKSEHYVWGISADRQLYRMSIGEGDIAVLKYDLAQWQIDEISVIRAVSDETILIGSKTSGLWQYDVRTQTAHQIFSRITYAIYYAILPQFVGLRQKMGSICMTLIPIRLSIGGKILMMYLQSRTMLSIPFIRIVKEESGVAAISEDFRMSLTASVSSKVSNRVRNTPGLRERLSGSSAKMRMAICGLEQKIMD